MEILNFKGPLLDLIYILKKGGSIHIKKKNRGKFTESAKRAGMGVQEYARHVLANKDKYSSTLVKRANFARNAKKFKHEDGGILKAQEGTGNLYAPHPLSPVGIALNQAKAVTKIKGEQHLPPGVKEVVGLDGKKIAIRTEQPLTPLEQSIAEWLPGTGDVAEVGYIVDDVKNGNLGSVALAAGLTFIPGNWKKVLDTLTPSKKDKFVDFFSKEIGKTVKRVPVTKNDFQGIYSEGFRYLDESGKEIAHIAGSRYGDRVFVESSFMDPEFRSKGIGKQMYFDFNDQMFNKYRKTIGSDSGQHMMTLETSPGIFISPSGRMWRGLRNKGLATTENPPIVSYIMAEPKAIKSYKKYSKGSKLKYQNPSGTLPDLIERVNTSKADFVQRLKDPNRQYIQDWLRPLDVATHKLGWSYDNRKKNKHGAFVFPMIQNINGKLVDFTYPRYLKNDGVNSAIERRDTVQMTPEQAEWFTKNYKSFYPSFDYGSR